MQHKPWTRPWWGRRGNTSESRLGGWDEPPGKSALRCRVSEWLAQAGPSPEILKRWFSERVGKEGQTSALGSMTGPQPGQSGCHQLLCTIMDAMMGPCVPGGCPSPPVAWNSLYVVSGILTPNAEDSRTQMQLPTVPTRLHSVSVAPGISTLNGKRI